MDDVNHEETDKRPDPPKPVTINANYLKLILRN